MCYACAVDALAALADPVRRELVGAARARRGGRRRAGRPLPGEPAGDQPAPAGAARGRPGHGRAPTGSGGSTRSTRAPLRELDDWLEPYRDLWAAAAGRTGHRDRPRSAGTRNGDRHDRGPRTPGAASSPRRTTGGSGWSSAASWPDPIDDVWAALTEPDRLARWIGVYDGERAGRRHRHLRHDPRGGRARRRADDDRRVRSAPAAGGRVGAAGHRRPGGSTSTSATEGGRTVLRFVQVFARRRRRHRLRDGLALVPGQARRRARRPRRRRATGTPSSPRSGPATAAPERGGRCDGLRNGPEGAR